MLTIPPQVSAEAAEAVVRARLPEAGALRTDLLHHPFSGLVFRVDQSALGRRLTLHVHTLVDLCSGAVAVCPPWPELSDELGAEAVQGPQPELSPDEVENQARQCVLRTLLHRRFSLRHPHVELEHQVRVIGKPNWLVRVEGEDYGVLVDGLTGMYHTVSLPRSAHHPA